VQKSYYFLHGLDSSGSGTKGRFFAANYPFVECPDFSGELENRMRQLEKICGKGSGLTFIGSSFGGLMATCFAIRYPGRVKALHLLAPALNFPGFSVPAHKIEVNTTIVIGEFDDVTPPDPVISLARATFVSPEVHIVKDDHFLHRTFDRLEWGKLLQ
jgi:pimeloyl-ACP methyl ester carboxylesterase